MSILTIDHVTKTYPAAGSSGEMINALDDVSIHVEEQEFLTILGPSGCGKTTLLRLAAGFEQPTRGKVLFQGKEVTKPGSDRVVVFQRPWLYPWLNVRDNIAFGLKLERKRVDWQRVDDMIRTVGLEGFAKSPPYRLSGGMQQRTALARALVMSPQVLLMDEPFGALDAQTRQLMQEFLLQLWDSISATVVFITHDIEEAILLGDRMVVMSAHPGRVALEMPINLPRPRDEGTTLDPRFVEIRRKALETLRGSVLAVSGITDGSRSLNEPSRNDKDPAAPGPSD